MTFCGIAAGAEYADLVIIEGEKGRTDLTLKLARRLRLQPGPRPAGFKALGNQISNILSEAKVERILIKQSVAWPSPKLPQMEAAEIRGLVFFIERLQNRRLRTCNRTRRGGLRVSSGLHA